MTQFIKLVNNIPTGNPILEQNFRQLFPNTSFPKYYTADVVEPLGYGLYDYRNQPDLDRYQKAVEVTPVRSDEGIWCQTWDVVDMNDEERAQTDANTASENRLKRDYLLQQCDWVIVLHTEKNTTVPSEWLNYRQALRDITTHANWPTLADDDWPTKP